MSHPSPCDLSPMYVSHPLPCGLSPMCVSHIPLWSISCVCLTHLPCGFPSSPSFWFIRTVFHFCFHLKYFLCLSQLTHPQYTSLIGDNELRSPQSRKLRDIVGHTPSFPGLFLFQVQCLKFPEYHHRRLEMFFKQLLFKFSVNFV